jgi:hypothetical protein
MNYERKHTRTAVERGAIFLISIGDDYQDLFAHNIRSHAMHVFDIRISAQQQTGGWTIHRGTRSAHLITLRSIGHLIGSHVGYKSKLYVPQAF